LVGSGLYVCARSWTVMFCVFEIGVYVDIGHMGLRCGSESFGSMGVEGV